MSYVSAVPDKVTAAATDLAQIGSTISAANSAAATPTTAALAAASDQVSAAIAAVFGEHAQGYQAIGAQLAAFHEQFVHALGAGADAYANAEASNAATMQAPS